MRGQRQAEGRRLALRSRATKGVLIEKTSNIQRQGLGSSVKGGRRSSTAVQKSVPYPSPPTTATPSAVLETDAQETKALWERVLGTKRLLDAEEGLWEQKRLLGAEEGL